jgi:murein DD-endopeptidase MepM/ murein hydrolase activator NlpD
MSKEYVVLDLAHSLNGAVKRFRISYRSLVYAGIALLFTAIVLVGLGFNYFWMIRKASNYDQLSADFQRLRGSYVELQRTSNQHQRQMASLELLASEVSVAYGINQPAAAAAGEDGAPLDSDTVPDLKSSLEQYNILQSASFSDIYHHYAYHWQAHNEPSLWPVIGVVRSSFGGRSDPFSGEGAFHTGIDLQAANGSPVHATADGVVEKAGWSNSYGKLVVVNHGNGLETYYAHLSQFDVVPGQEVRRGEVIALSGCTGRATGPHVHYEVRLRGTPVNPYRYLVRASTPVTVSDNNHNDLGL